MLTSNPKEDGMRQINRIIIHCSATPEGRDVSADEIRQWHLKRGFRDIGYHWVIRLDGTVEAGRPEKERGAHARGHNHDSIGICYIGGLATDVKTPKDTRTPEQRAALRSLIGDTIFRHGDLTLHGHREFARKACPSFDVSQEDFTERKEDNASC